CRQCDARIHLGKQRPRTGQNLSGDPAAKGGLFSRDGRRNIVSRNIAERSAKSSPSPARRPKRIIGLFPELLGVGGIQEAGRQTASALVEFARRRGWESLFLSLNDSPQDERLSFGTLEIPFRGFGRAKVQFFLA